MKNHAAIIGNLETLTLSMINERPMHGYQILLNIRRKYGAYLGPSTIYPMLKVLQQAKLVESSWEIDEDRPKKVYKITSAGEKKLRLNALEMQVIFADVSKVLQV